MKYPSCWYLEITNGKFNYHAFIRLKNRVTNKNSWRAKWDNKYFSVVVNEARDCVVTV